MIKVNNLKKHFGPNLVFENLSFQTNQGSICTVIGPSGCGKSTILNLISGIDNPESGSITIENAENSRTSIGYMTQDSPMLPWRTLQENALLGLEIKKGRKRFSHKHTANYFDLFDLSKSKDLYPSESSGGMKQRIALIRTLLTRPNVMLLDEPFSNLDFDIKLNIQKHLLNFHLLNHTSILLVTHDIEDAIALSDKVLILSEKPTKVKLELRIDLGIQHKDPIEARKSLCFRDYFIKIWNELKYLNRS